MRVALTIVLLAIGSVAQAQHGIQLAPGERLVAIDGVPVSQHQSSHVDGNIVGNLRRSNMPFSHTPGNTALEKANYERSYLYGQGPLRPDSRLQALALRKATIAAQRRHKNHVGHSFGGAKCEGVGWTNGRFLSCCLDEHGTYGGAAMVRGSDGWYCCLLVR